MNARRSVIALVAASSVLVGFTAASRATIHSWLGDCDVYFDNEFALENVHAQARTTFAYPTGLASGGGTEPCNESVHLACWTYRHRCHLNYVNVESITYGHVHLSFEDPNLTCFVDPGDGGGTGFGRPSGSSCVAANWGEEPRILQSHDQNHWIRIFVESSVDDEPKVFDMPEIYVGGDKPIQLWIKHVDGTWHCWRELAPRTRWDLDEWAHDLIEVRMRGANSGLGADTIRGFTILD